MSEDIDIETESMMNFLRTKCPDYHKVVQHYPRHSSIVVDYKELQKVGSIGLKLADRLRADPKYTVACLENAFFELSKISNGDVEANKMLRTITFRFINLPWKKPIRMVRSGDVNNLLAFEGICRMVSAVKPKITVAVFRCKHCGNTVRVPQRTRTLEYPESTECSHCNSSTKWVHDVSQDTFANVQFVTIQEFHEGLKASEQPHSIGVELLDDLCGVVNAGYRTTINGVLRVIEGKGRSLVVNTIVEANMIELGDQTFTDIQIGEEDVEKIKELAKLPNIHEVLAGSIAPSIYGHDLVKTALVLQLFGGVTRTEKSSRIRGDIHMLLLGDPGIAKSQMLDFLSLVSPRGVKASGGQSSSVGLTCAAKQDANGEWTLEGGALVLADGGLCCIDEFDKMEKEDRAAIHGAMEQQCYDDQTELLTESGWKKFEELRDGERVASLKDGVLVYEYPSMYISSYYDGDMYYIKSRQVDLAVSPNHNLYVDINKRANEWCGLSFTKANELPTTRMRFKKNAVWFGTPSHTHMVPAVTKYNNQNCDGVRTRSVVIPMNIWLEFLGYFISEGSITRNTKTKVPYSVRITQTKPDSVQTIRECLDKLGFKYSYNGHSFIICSKQLAADLEVYGKCCDKFVPDYVKSLPPEQIQIFVDALVVGDGHVEPNGVTVYTTTSKFLADDLSELLLKIGISGNVRNTVKIGEVSKCGKDRNYISKNGTYVVSFIREHSNNPSINTNGKNHITKTNYKGRIYCIQVPSHVIYVRRNGIPVWCGNCINVNKAGMNATLMTRCSILAAANPKSGRWDMFKNLSEQVELPPSLLSRFDLIFILRDIPNGLTDDKIAEHILDGLSTSNDAVPIELLRKYIAYARREVNPKLSEEAKTIIKNFYLKLRGMGKDGSVPITPRKLEDLKRLTCASARIRLSKVADEMDAKIAVQLVDACLRDVAYDAKSKSFDIDRVICSTSSAQRSHIALIKDALRGYGKPMPIVDVYTAVINHLNKQETDIAIEKMQLNAWVAVSRTGDVTLL